MFSFLLLLQDTDQQQLANEKVCCSLQIPVCHQRNSGQEHKEETQRQEWKQALCRMLVVTDLLPLTCSVSIFIQPRPNCLVMELPTVGRSLLHQLANKKMFLQTSPQVNMIERCPHLRFPFHRYVNLTTDANNDT